MTATLVPQTNLIRSDRVSFQQTVRRELVHRASVSEVFVTDVVAIDDSTFLVGAQWPRCHGFFGPVDETAHDPMLFVETVRQAGLAVAHEVLGVPFGHSFLSHAKDYWITEAGVAVGGRPVDVLLQVTIPGLDAQRKTRRRMNMVFECFRDGELIGGARVPWSCISPQSYARLRGSSLASAGRPASALPAPVAPHLVGRVREIDVMLAPTGVPGAWTLRIDRRHPVHFDHPVDHVPGMAFMEAARQAALALTARPHALPLAGSFTFDRYIELDEPCVITARRQSPGSDVIEVFGDQSGNRVASGSLTLSAEG